jgi:hypothetical protein
MKIILSENKKKKLIEELAELEHKQWEEWSKDISKKEDISKDRLDRWKEYWTSYSSLDEDVKDDDREWAEKIYNTIEKYLK